MARNHNPDIEEELRKLREKQAAVEAGEAPVGVGKEEPARIESKPPVAPHEIPLADDNTYLRDLLRRTAVHIAARNAMGEKSKVFCCACNNARHEACLLPEIWQVVGE